MNKKPIWLESIVNLPDIDINIKSFGGHKQEVTYPWSVETETHFVFEIMLIISGQQKTTFEGFTTYSSENSIMLIPPGMAHTNSCESKNGLSYFCLHFDISDPSIQQALLMYCPISLDKNNKYFEDIKNVLYNYVFLLERQEFNLQDKLYVEKQLIELILSLVNYADCEEKNENVSNGTALVLAKQIGNCIQSNFRKFTEAPTDENRYLLSIPYVAKELGMSESMMLKEFKKVYFISPKNYLDKLRFNEARFLLQQPKLSINEISEIVGYQNVSHFSRQFKKWSGYSPNKYKRELFNNFKCK
ncbi:AraC family transcriptional regulator [Vagococcus sp. JNUCC 83]